MREACGHSFGAICLLIVRLVTTVAGYDGLNSH